LSTTNTTHRLACTRAHTHVLIHTRMHTCVHPAAWPISIRAHIHKTLERAASLSPDSQVLVEEHRQHEVEPAAVAPARTRPHPLPWRCCMRVSPSPPRLLVRMRAAARCTLAHALQFPEHYAAHIARGAPVCSVCINVCGAVVCMCECSLFATTTLHGSITASLRTRPGARVDVLRTS
jgi:hypothetical protein